MGKSVAAELLEERVLWDETPLGVPCLHTYLILLMIHSFFFSLAGNLQTAYTKIKDVSCSSQLDYTWKKNSKKKKYSKNKKFSSFGGPIFGTKLQTLGRE